jgi:hypothetical protein
LGNARKSLKVGGLPTHGACNSCQKERKMRTLFHVLLASLFAGVLSVGYAADTAKCDKLTGAEKEKCLNDARK